jgi:galactokinase
MDQLAQSFRDLYDEEPRVYRAPGRVNLIGEHTDYNAGFVMPMAIEAATLIAVAPRPDRRIVIRSENFSETEEFDLDEPGGRRGHWSDYPRGVAFILEQDGHHLRGANILLRGEVPVGAGLSSSAALEVATGYALLDCSAVTVARLQLALACQRAENEFVGMRCGLMDQFTACFAERGRALRLDCRSLAFDQHPLPGGVKVVVCNTMVRHELAASEYNLRRAECEEGVRLLSQHLPGVRSLRDLTVTELESCRIRLPETIYKRCRHVVIENARVVAAAVALEEGDSTTFGKLMNESHCSLRDDYEVSCAELDLLVNLAHECKVYGARMTGGGFGGCTVNLVDDGKVDEFRSSVTSGYARVTGVEPETYVCSPAQGVERVM